MRILSSTGELVSVRERAWPLAGTMNPDLLQNGRSVIPMATRPGGPPDLATFVRIYRENPWVYAAVTALTHGLSRLDINTFQYDKLGDGDFDRVYGMLPGSTGRPSAGASLDQLMHEPEPGVSRHEWLRKLGLDRKVYGNALAVIDRDGNGLPTALWHMPWKRVVVHEGVLVPILSYEIQGDKGSVFYSPDQVIHIGRGDNIDSAVGLSPIASLRHTVALHDALQRHLVAYFQNSARPSGILKVDKGTGEPAQKIIQEKVRELYASPESAGKIMVTSAEWQSLSEDPQSSQIVELAKLSREEIAAVFRVPPPVLGILDRAIKSNVGELRSQFVRDVLGPDADDFQSAINTQLIGRVPQWSTAGNFVRFDMDSPLRPDLEARAGVYEQMRSVLTPNEMRKLEHRKPLTGEAGKYADTVSLPSGQVFLGLAQPQSNPDGSPGGHPVAADGTETKAVPIKTDGAA